MSACNNVIGFPRLRRERRRTHIVNDTPVHFIGSRQLGELTSRAFGEHVRAFHIALDACQRPLREQADVFAAANHDVNGYELLRRLHETARTLALMADVAAEGKKRVEAALIDAGALDFPA